MGVARTDTVPYSVPREHGLELFADIDDAVSQFVSARPLLQEALDLPDAREKRCERVPLHQDSSIRERFFFMTRKLPTCSEKTFYG